MNLFPNLSDLPIDVVSVLFLLLISLASWIKTRFFSKPEEYLGPEVDDPMREIIWRRQTGEEMAPPPLEKPPVLPAAVTRRTKPVVMATPPRLPAAKVVVTERQAALAKAFEDSYRIREHRRSSHRSEIDKLLASPYAAKNAILLTEILGTPVGLKTEGR